MAGVKLLSFFPPSLRLPLRSGHFRPRKSSLSPPKVITWPPLRDCAETRCAVGRLKISLKLAKDGGETAVLSAQRGEFLCATTLKRPCCALPTIVNRHCAL